MGSDLRFSGEGKLELPKDKLGKLSQVDPQQMRLVQLCDDLLICAQELPGRRERALLYGDLRLFHVAELMALISSMRKDGTLTLYVPHARKVVYFIDGEVVYASSSVEDDRLGEVLWRRGFLSLEQLSDVYDLVQPGKKLGRVLIDRGLLTPRKLYDGIREQVMEIVFSTFHFVRGEFVFVEGRPALRSPVRLEVETRKLLQDGIQRVREMTRMEELFPDRAAVLLSRPVAVGVQLNDHQQHLNGLIDGRRSVADLVEQSHLGEFEALKALADLVKLGLVEAMKGNDKGPEEEGDTPHVLAAYGLLLRRIHQTLKVESPGSERRIEEYTSSPAKAHREVFRNVEVDGDGQIDVDTLFRNARGQGDQSAPQLALAALRALYDYAVFQAMDVLDDESCDALMERLESKRAKLDH